MMESDLETAADEQMVCPTCKARQVWSDECRRCRCDLSLLRQWHAACERQRRRCFQDLRRGDFEQALRNAQQFARMAGRSQAAPLLAVCHLLCRDWPAALGTLP